MNPLCLSALLGLSCGFAAALGQSLAGPLPPAANRPVDFVSEVYPVIREACFRCHGPEKQKGKYRMDSREEAFRETSEWGPAIKPGDSKSSPIVLMMAGSIDEMLMPPPGGKPGESDPLTADQIGLIRAWIDQGAKWPDGPIQVRPKELTFKGHILPALQSSCAECHSASRSEGGFSVDSLASVLKGGATYGKAVLPGNPERSPLITIVSGKDEDIPLPQRHRLPEKVVKTLREWVLSGAKE